VVGTPNATHEGMNRFLICSKLKENQQPANDQGDWKTVSSPVATSEQYPAEQSRFEWVRMAVVGPVSFSSVWKFDSRATCRIRYEGANGQVIEHQLVPREELKIAPTR
jgi:hypothetical protein